MTFKYRRTSSHGDYKYVLTQNFSRSLLTCMAETKGTIVGENGGITYGKVKNGCIRLKKNYTWNGADYCPDFECIMEASLVHDALYQLIEKGRRLKEEGRSCPGHTIFPEHKKCADQQLYCMVKASCSPWLASTMYNAVRSYQTARRPWKRPAGFFGGLWGASLGFAFGKKIQCNWVPRHDEG